MGAGQLGMVIALALGGAVMAAGWGYLTDLIPFRLVLVTGIVLLLISGIIGYYTLKATSEAV